MASDRRQSNGEPPVAGLGRWWIVVAILAIAVLTVAMAFRALYLGPAYEAAPRIEAAHSPIVDRVIYLDPNPFEGAGSSLHIFLKHDTTQEQVDAFWCDVVLPAGGTEAMYRAQSLTLFRSGQQAGENGEFYPSLRCANATPMPRPSPRFAPAATTECAISAVPSAPHDCPAAIAEVGTILADTGLEIATIVIRPYWTPCLLPFQRDPDQCVLDRTRATAWVTFVGSDKVATVTIESRPSGPWAYVDYLLVPPTGWAIPPVDLAGRPPSS